MAKKSTIPKSKAKTAYGLLREICALALDEPKRLHMGQWIVTNADQFGWNNVPRCGTVGCVAGWAIHLREPQWHASHQGESYSRAANRILGLSAEQGDSLYYDIPYDTEEGTPEHAKESVARLRKFMAVNASQLKAHRLDPIVRTT